MNALDSLPILSQIARLVADWIPPAASLAVSDEQQYVLYHPGAYDLRIQPGAPIPTGSISERVLHTHARVEAGVDASVFGLPYYGLGYPLLGEEGSFGAVTVILPPGFQSHSEALSFVMGQTADIWRPVPVEKIGYFESRQKRTQLYAGGEQYTCTQTLQVLERRLPQNQFLRIHRSYIVNIACVDHISRDIHSNMWINLLPPDSVTLPVGQTYLRHVRQKLGF